MARSSGRGFDLKCASCGRGLESRDGASILRVHLVVVARSPGEWFHSWWPSLVAELILPIHGSGAWRRNSPISTHGSGAWWRGLVAELAPSTHGSGPILSVHLVVVVWSPGTGLRSCACILWSWSGAPGRGFTHGSGAIVAEFGGGAHSPFMVAELGVGTRPSPLMVAERGGEAWWRSSPPPLMVAERS